MDPVPESRLPWRIGGPGSTGVLIVAFVGVTVLDVVLTGSLSAKHITIQPCFTIDSNTISGGGSTTSTFVYKPLAITR